MYDYLLPIIGIVVLSLVIMSAIAAIIAKKTGKSLVNGFSALGGHVFSKWLLITAAIVTVVASFVAIVLNWAALMLRLRGPVPPSTTPPNIDTPAATPWWDFSTADYASYLPTWWMQALLAALAILLATLLLIAIFKGPGRVLSGRGAVGALLLFIGLSLLLFAVYPYLVSAAKEAPDSAIRFWGSVQDAAKWFVLIALGAAVFIGIINGRKGLTPGELATAFGVWVIVFFLIGPMVVQKDWSQDTRPVVQQAYAPAAPTSPCHRRDVEYTFEATKPSTPIVPMGQCKLALWHKGHCVYTLSYKGRVPKKACDFGHGLVGEYAVNTEYVWSAGNAFTSKYRPEPDPNPRLFSFVQ